MPIPEFDNKGGLPSGVHRATLEEVIARFGASGDRRRYVTDIFLRALNIAKATAKLERCVLFGSYVTAKAEPRDVDIVFVMADSFRPAAFEKETQMLFDHQRAEQELGASVFYARPGLLMESVESFLAGWQTNRGGTLRGIIEVVL